jgi:hypothetical protein
MPKAAHSKETRSKSRLVRLQPSVLERADALAVEAGRSFSNYVEWLILQQPEPAKTQIKSEQTGD